MIFFYLWQVAYCLSPSETSRLQDVSGFRMLYSLVSCPFFESLFSSAVPKFCLLQMIGAHRLCSHQCDMVGWPAVPALPEASGSSFLLRRVESSHCADTCIHLHSTLWPWVISLSQLPFPPSTPTFSLKSFTINNHKVSCGSPSACSPVY